MSFYEMRNGLAREIAAVLAHREVTAEIVAAEFTTPPSIALGHLALPCFRLAKMLGVASDDLARSLVDRLSASAACQATAAGPYANFRWPPDVLYRAVISQIFAEKDGYGGDSSGGGRTVVFEYCSPNIARKLGFQHLRSMVIGNVLANVHRALGYRPERVCFVGDWGGEPARLLAAIDLWGDKDLLSRGESAPAAIMDHLFELDARFRRGLDTEPTYGERAARWRQQLESGDTRALTLWQQVRVASLSAMQSTLRRLSIAFDHIEGESAYVADIKNVLEEVKARAGARLSEGAWIVDIEGCPTPALVQKKDGSTLYLTRDIAAAIDRYRRFPAEKMGYVVSEQQRLHFQLLFGVLAKMGYQWARACEHIAFGTVLLEQEKMSTREGHVIFLDDVLNEARARALEECNVKTPDLVDRDGVAEIIGVGAVVFGVLSVHRAREIEFRWETALALDGDTGPYVQYAAARCQSLLVKAAAKGETPDGPVVTSGLTGYLFGAEEEALIVALGKFGVTLHQVARDSEPSLLTHYLVDLAKAFNRFYYRFPVLQAGDDAQRQMRLALVEATRQTLANGLRLLGLSCPPEM